MRYKTIKYFNDNEKVQKEKIMRAEQLQKCKDLIMDIDKIRELRRLGSDKWKEYKSSCVVNVKKYPEVGVYRLMFLSK